MNPSAVTAGPLSHWGGYYDKTPWDATGRYILALENDFDTRPPTVTDEVTIGLVDTHNHDTWIALTTTGAWCWQLGARQQWWEAEPERKIIYNDRRDGQFVSVVRDVFSGEERVLPMPVYDITRDGATAFTLNFARLGRLRPGYGYPGGHDPGVRDPHPDDDGIWRMDLCTGELQLLVSYAQVAAIDPRPDMDGVQHWFNHIAVNPDGDRLFFFHRWEDVSDSVEYWYTRLLTVDADGGAPFVFTHFASVSHYDWYDDRHLLLAATCPGDPEYSLRLVEDRNPDSLGEVLLSGNSGHCSFSPDRRWLLTDTYPDKVDRKQSLILQDTTTRRTETLGRFTLPDAIVGEYRCDLHPRWSRDSRRICFDSAHSGQRQMYVRDLTKPLKDAE